VRLTLTSVCAPAAKAGTSTAAGLPIGSPEIKINFVPGFQSQEPELAKRQVFTKGVPGANTVLSGIVTSVTKRAPRTQPGVFVGAGVGVGGRTVASVTIAWGVAGGMVGVAVTTTVGSRLQAIKGSKKKTTTVKVKRGESFFITTPPK
jgi:hypothetical protein